MAPRTWSALPTSLARALDAAVGHALVSAVAAGAGTACGGQSAGQDVETLAPAFSFAGGEADGSQTPMPGAGEPDRAPAGLQDRSAEACLVTGTSRFGEMRVAEPYEFLALRSVQDNGFDPTGVPVGGTELEAWGRACESALDVPACRAALDSAWPAPGNDWTECGQAGCVTYAVVSTRGDTVRLHDDFPEILSVLGAIDTPVEAAFWADVNGYTPICSADSIFGLSPLEVMELEGGYRLRNYEMVAICPIVFQGVVLDIARDGRLMEAERFAPPPSTVSGCVGRRPPGLLAAPSSQHASEVGGFFASVAALEAAAVTAFHVIEAELAALGAPAELRAAARDAAADEERHWRITSTLAAEWGVAAVRPRVEPRPLRALFDVALDNVVEGCVRETFGAAVARYQAACAADARVRELLAQIAEDERRHAELSFRIQAWLEPLLNADELARLELAAREAIAELRAEQRAESLWSVRRHAGMPSAAAAARLIDALEARLWSAALRAA